MTAFPTTSGSTDGFSGNDDGALLRAFASGNGQAAFTALVRRHSGLVFSTALRRTNSPELAQEAAQNVFAALAGKAARLVSLTNLSPWLHRAAVLESAALLRREIRYRQAMKRRQEDPVLAAMSPHPDSTGNVWNSVSSLVDEALDGLSTTDREVLLLHHGEGWSFREIADRLRLSPEAAQRRGHRALEKLAGRLRQRGVAVPALALSGALTSGLASDVSAAVSAMGPLWAAECAGKIGAPPPAAPGFPAWVGAPAVLVAAGLAAAAIPMLRALRERDTPPSPGVGQVDSMITPPPGAATPPAPGPPAASPRNYLAEAIAALKQSPADAGPTKPGLQLRKYMFALHASELRAAGRLLKDYPASHREMLTVVEAFSTRLAELEPDLALGLLQGSAGKDADPDFSKSTDRAALLDVLSRHYLPALIEKGRSHPALLSGALEALASHDGPSAMEYTARLAASEERQHLYRKCFDAWASGQPPGALQWLDDYLMANPDLAVALRKDWALEHNLSSVVRRCDPAQTVELITLLKDDQLRNDVLQAFYFSHGNDHPETMLRLLPWLRLEDDALSVSVANLVFSWRRKDPAGAIHWVASLPDGELKTAAERNLAKPDPFAK